MKAKFLILYFVLFSYALIADSGRIIKDRSDIVYDNLTIGYPKTPGIIIDRIGYAFCYSEKYEQPLWVQYKLTKNEVLNRKVKRKNNFRSDPLINTGSAALEDYRRSGYDRGHLAPAGDMVWSKEAMSESFFMSNMSPQVAGFNRGIWKHLESLIRRWAIKYGEIYVITGAIFQDDQRTIGKNKVAVPKFYYKIIFIDGADPKVIGFVFPNEKTKKPIHSFVVSVDQIEAATSLNFLNKLPKDLEQQLESHSFKNLWSF